MEGSWRKWDGSGGGRWFMESGEAESEDSVG